MAFVKQVEVYTDGACSGNPGPGGYAAVLTFKRHRREIARGFRRTTNNRMELMAVIAGLKALKQSCRVAVYSDSEYVVNAMGKGWARKWRANGWRRSQRERVLNVDLWEELLSLSADHDVRFHWVKGHAGNVENERCDKLAVEAATMAASDVDIGYENQTEVKQRR